MSDTQLAELAWGAVWAGWGHAVALAGLTGVVPAELLRVYKKRLTNRPSAYAIADAAHRLFALVVVAQCLLCAPLWRDTYTLETEGISGLDSVRCTADLRTGEASVLATCDDGGSFELGQDRVTRAGYGRLLLLPHTRAPVYLDAP